MRGCLIVRTAGFVLLAVIILLPTETLRAWDDAAPSANLSDGDGYKPAPLRYSQMVPGLGYGWSQARYPGQYEASNLASNRLVGLDDRDNERFFDVANRAFSRAFVTGFSYTDAAKRRPTVTVTYCRRAETFVGCIRARGLKPHFAYQIKLCGDFASDPAGFERIGRLGRWRRIGSPQTNFIDYDFDSARDKSTFESYILFDFLVTDHNGDADKTFYLDSTLHVLFNQPKQGTPRAADSKPRRVDFTCTDGWFYANPKTNVEPHWVFAETEAGSNGQIRPGIGQAFLPDGRYRARLLLSEESFHGYGDGGFWAAVMACDVAFEVVRRPMPPPLVWQADDLTGGRTISLAGGMAMHAVVTDASTNTCRFTPDGGPDHPRLILGQALPVDPGRRQIVAFEVRIDGLRHGYLLVGKNRQMRAADSFRLPAGGYYDWQPVEVALAPDPAARQIFLGFLMPRENNAITIRSLRLVTLRE